MPSTAPIFVAIDEDSGVYKHWSLFIDGPNEMEKTVLHIMGSSTNYWFEMRNSNPRHLESVVELIHMWDVKLSDIPVIKNAARNAVIHNEFPGYNCQDYVMEFLDDLVARGIIDGADKEYENRRAYLSSKLEGY